MKQILPGQSVLCLTLSVLIGASTGCDKQSTAQPGQSPRPVPDILPADDHTQQQPPAAPPSPHPTPAVGLPWLNTYQSIESDRQRHAYIAEKLAVESGDLTSAVSVALDDSFPPIRRDAIAMVSQLTPEDSAPLLLRAASDPDELLRHDALSGIGRLPEPYKLRALMDALDSPYPDIKLQIIPRLANTRNPDAFGAMLLAIDNTHPELLAAVNAQSEALVDKVFTDSQSAAVWWLENRDRFDDQMRPVTAQK